MRFIILEPKGKFKDWAVFCPDIKRARRFPTRKGAEACLQQCILEGQFPFERPEPKAVINVVDDPFELTP